MATKTAVNYKRRLLSVRQQMASGRANVFDVATNLVAVFDDDDFRAEIGATDDFAAAQALSAEVADLCVDFLELRAMLQEFPNREVWESTQLAKLYDQARERIASRKAVEEKPARVRTSVKLADVEKLKAEKQDLQAQVNFGRQQQSSLSEQLAEALKEIESLRLENATLRGRIAELEKIVERMQSK